MQSVLNMRFMAAADVAVRAVRLWERSRNEDRAKMETGQTARGIHGGDIYQNRVKLDFSVNTNPLGVPEAVREALQRAAGDCGHYPDIAQKGLKKAVGGMLGVPEETLVFGNGASELFMALVRAVAPKRTVIPVPSFYGYEYAASASESVIVYCGMRAEDHFCPGEELFSLLKAETDLLFLANPNNPTGRLLDREYLRAVLTHCRERGIYVALDECFVSLCAEEASMLGEAESFHNLILVGAFTKSFAIPGVRLGYLVCYDEKLLQNIKKQLPEWNVSVFAQAAGAACAEEKAYLERTVRYVERERDFLTKGLQELGITVFPGAANFLLLKSGRDLYGELLGQGILIRDCRNFRGLSEGYYRVAVKSREENEVLLQALKR